MPRRSVRAHVIGVVGDPDLLQAGLHEQRVTGVVLDEQDRRVRDTLDRRELEDAHPGGPSLRA